MALTDQAVAVLAEQLEVQHFLPYKQSLMVAQVVLVFA
jgi:hypothetical protein